FGLVHLLLVPNITVIDVLSIVAGGLLFAAAYLRTSRLWLPIALHASLDFSVDGIFGVGAYSLAGVPAAGLLQARLVGPVLLTGGAAGAEASLVTSAVVLAAGAYLLMRPPTLKQEKA